MTTAQDGGKFVSLKHRLLLPPRKYSWYSFMLEAESTPGPWCDRKDFMSMKNPLTPAGIFFLYCTNLFQFVSETIHM